MAVARSSSGRVTKSQGARTVWGVFFHNDNALYNIAFGTHTKTAEPIEMPFGMMSQLGPSNSVSRGGDEIPKGEGAILGENMCTSSLTPSMNCELDWSMQWPALDRGRRLIASVWWVYYRPQRGWDCTPRAKSDIYDCLVHLAERNELILNQKLPVNFVKWQIHALYCLSMKYITTRG